LSPLVISLLACALMLLGAVGGARLRRSLPDHHLDERTKEIVRLGAGLIAAIAAVMLGFLINSASITFGGVVPVPRNGAGFLRLDADLERADRQGAAASQPLMKTVEFPRGNRRSTCPAIALT